MDTNNQKNALSGRLLSLDALRGFDMFWIIGGEWIFKALTDIWDNPTTQHIELQLTHVKWEGFHFYDLIYPLFLFIIGVTLPFALTRRKQSGQSRYKLYLKILKRSLMLIVLGSIPYGLFHFTDWPFLGGVLAHIGLCYFFATPIIMDTSWRTRAVIVVGFLLIYWMASALIPVPGFGAGVYTEEGCLASFIDSQFISGRLWNEGPTSILSGICIILWGSLAGHWLRTSHSANRKAGMLMLAGILCVILGYIWGFSFPIIKRIVWSSSYVSIACGWSLLLLGIFYWIIDAKGYRKWAFFFVVIGTNAITIYFLQGVVNFGEIASLFFTGISEYAGMIQPLVLPVGVMAVKWLLLLFLFRNKLFFKV
ncbi:acyltransferase family protein [Bacteroidota bacterium]